MVTPLSAQQTLDRARAVLQSGAAAGLPELLKLIETLSTDIFKVSLDELSGLIEKDAAVMAKVVTVANTLAHNPGIAPIATIAQAIHRVGFQRIRSLAVSLMLLENTGGARNPPEQRAAAAQALCAGLLAQGCAERLGTLDPDIAFACATLRHFGDIVLPAVSAEHTRAALERLKTKPPDLAWRGVFGLTPLELSRRLLETARLPEEVLRTLREAEPATLAGTATKFETRLLGVAMFGSRLARLALDPALDPAGFALSSRRTAQGFAPLLPDAPELVAPAVVRTGERLLEFARSSGLGALPTQNLGRVRMHAHHLDPAAAAETGLPPAVAPAAIPAAIAAPAEAPADPVALPEPVVAAAEAAPEPWDAALAQSGAFATQAFAPAADPLAAALALARDAAQADTCWLLRPPAGGTSLTLAGGTGEIWRRFHARAAVRADERSVFGVCLSRREVVVLHDTADPGLAPYLPDWWRAADGAPCALALVPVAAASSPAPAALALLGWDRPRRVTLSPAQAGLVQRVCAEAVAATEARAAA